ncbi:MAG TPA: hypothetical protein P5274_02360 [Candidatus Paceibacterota bacterium]|nr:hypothetical protein [Candidatus Paceibacterota bacterium]
MRKLKLTNFFQRIIHKSLDLIFPCYCFGCQREGTRLCQECLNNLPRSFCSGEEKIFSVFDYNSPIVKQAVWALKYKRGIDLAKTFAQAMSDTLLEELADKLIVACSKSNFWVPRSWTSNKLPTQIIVIPVPLSPTRRRERGYNQAEELAKQMADINPEQFCLETNLIKKIKDTPTQVSIKNRKQRLVNLKGAFKLNPKGGLCSKLDFWAPRSPTSNSTSGKIFVIIDDVSTTGATIGEIRQLLKKAGFNRTYGLVLAHG